MGNSKNALSFLGTSISIKKTHEFRNLQCLKTVSYKKYLFTWEEDGKLTGSCGST